MLTRCGVIKEGHQSPCFGQGPLYGTTGGLRPFLSQLEPITNGQLECVAEAWDPDQSTFFTSNLEYKYNTKF